MAFRACYDGDLVGGSVQIRVAAPDHVLAQLLAHDLHLMLLEEGALELKKVRPFLFSAIHLPAKVPSWMSERTARMRALVSSWG